MRYVIDSVVDMGAGAQSMGTETAEIINLAYPSDVEINTPFTVAYDGWNKTTGSLTLFGYIQEAGVGMIADSYWEAAVDSNQIYAGDYYFSNGISIPFSGQVVLGHVELVPCEQITDPTECINAGCEWYGNSCHTPEGPTCEEYVTASECIAAGCEWYDNSCHTPGGGINWMIAGPVIAVVGIAFVVGIAVRKKK